MPWLDFFVNSEHNWLVNIMMPEFQIVTCDAALLAVLFGAEFHSIWDWEPIFEAHYLSWNWARPPLVRGGLGWSGVLWPLGVDRPWTLLSTTWSGGELKTVGSHIQGVPRFILDSPDQGSLVPHMLIRSWRSLLVVAHSGLEALSQFWQHDLVWPNDYSVALILRLEIAKTCGRLVKFTAV